MIDLEDTIVALSSAAGPGRRGIVRLTGPNAFAILAHVGQAASVPEDERSAARGRYSVVLSLDDGSVQLPADVIRASGPRTFTGQDIVEIHTISSPPLIELLIAECLNAGARAAQPGEFTLRGFLKGKLDLTQAEAILGVIDAGSRDQLRSALAQLAGNVARPLTLLRDDLLNLLADVEAGLDFSDEDLTFVGQTDLLRRLTHGLAQVTLVQKQMEQRSIESTAFRVVLTGPTNAGKSSLFNALIGRDAAIVSPIAGATRDYLSARVTWDGVPLELIDTAGMRAPADSMERNAQALGKDKTRDADVVLWCSPADDPSDGPPSAIRVLTKADLTDLSRSPSARGLKGVDDHATSTLTGAGVTSLRHFLVQRARATSPLAPSTSRCRSHLAACLDHLRRAHRTVLNGDPPEILALELRGALEELGSLVGAVYTDDLLDRIFSRFCIGK